MLGVGILTKEAQRQAGEAQGHSGTQKTSVQYLTACESKRSKRNQVRESSRCEGGAEGF